MIDDCSKNCGNGTRTKHRTKTLDEANGGICDGTDTEEENCNTQDCAGKFTNLQSLHLYAQNKVFITYTYEYVYLFLFLILGIGYSLTAKDELCGEGVVTVDEIQRCQEAAKEFDLPFKATMVYYTDRPKGCYLDTSDDSVLFNTHSTGSSNSIARQICKPDGKKYTSFHKSLSSLIEKDM